MAIAAAAVASAFSTASLSVSLPSAGQQDEFDTDMPLNAGARRAIDSSSTGKLRDRHDSSS